MWSALMLWVYLQIYMIYIISESGAKWSQIRFCFLLPIVLHYSIPYSLPATYFSSTPGSTQQLHRNSEGSYQCGMRPGHLWQCECGSFHIYKCKRWWFQRFWKCLNNCFLQRLQTALHIAAEHGWLNIAEIILISGVNLNLLDKVQFPVIIHGCGRYIFIL